MHDDIERIVADGFIKFDLSWKLEEGIEPLKPWQVGYLTAVVASAIDDVRSNRIPREVRREFERVVSNLDFKSTEEGVVVS